MTQSVFDFVRCVQEENSDAARSSMLDYLSNLIEGASDFSWESAKASHEIVLTHMEVDCLRWTDTDKLDRIWRAQSQRHSALGQSNASKTPYRKQVKTIGLKNGVVCQYFSRGYL